VFWITKCFEDGSFLKLSGFFKFCSFTFNYIGFWPVDMRSGRHTCTTRNARTSYENYLSLRRRISSHSSLLCLIT